MVRGIIYLSCLLCLLSQAAFAVFNKDNYTDNKDRKKIRKEADIFFEKKAYSKALTFYARLYKMDSLNNELNYKIGICYYNSKDAKSRAFRYFNRSKTDFPEALFYLGNLYHAVHKFNEAIQSFEAYKKLPGKKDNDSALIELMISKSKNADEMIKYPLNVVIHNMGCGINSSYPDYAPLVTADESMLIFTSRRNLSTGRIKDLNGDYMEDIYVSTKDKSGVWSAPKGLSKNINTEFHDASVAISADGQQLIVYRTSDDLLSGDLYTSYYTGKDWTVPEMLGSDINMDDALEAGATLSPDNSMLIFSSNRPGGYGGKDLYRAIKMPNGQWSKAQNLGNKINTPYDEDGPFIHADGKTLYFSSKAHKNIGGYDVFKSSLNDDGSLSEPENIGYPINTVNDDIFVFSTNGNRAYFSSENDVSCGGTDIYYLDIRDQNFGLAILTCKVSTSDSVPIAANISIMDKNNMSFNNRYTSNGMTGKFIMVIHPNRTYELTVRAEGCATHTEELFFSPSDFKDGVIELSFKLLKNSVK